MWSVWFCFSCLSYTHFTKTVPRSCLWEQQFLFWWSFSTGLTSLIFQVITVQNRFLAILKEMVNLYTQMMSRSFMECHIFSPEMQQEMRRVKSLKPLSIWTIPLISCLTLKREKWMAYGLTLLLQWLLLFTSIHVASGFFSDLSRLSCQKRQSSCCFSTINSWTIVTLARRNHQAKF